MAQETTDPDRPPARRKGDDDRGRRRRIELIKHHLEERPMMDRASDRITVASNLTDILDQAKKAGITRRAIAEEAGHGEGDDAISRLRRFVLPTGLTREQVKARSEKLTRKAELYIRIARAAAELTCEGAHDETYILRLFEGSSFDSKDADPSTEAELDPYGDFTIFLHQLCDRIGKATGLETYFQSICDHHAARCPSTENRFFSALPDDVPCEADEFLNGDGFMEHGRLLPSVPLCHAAKGRPIPVQLAIAKKPISSDRLNNLFESGSNGFWHSCLAFRDELRSADHAREFTFCDANLNVLSEVRLGIAPMFQINRFCAAFERRTTFQFTDLNPDFISGAHYTQEIGFGFDIKDCDAVPLLKLISYQEAENPEALYPFFIRGPDKEIELPCLPDEKFSADYKEHWKLVALPPGGFIRIERVTPANLKSYLCDLDAISADELGYGWEEYFSGFPNGTVAADLERNLSYESGENRIDHKLAREAAILKEGLDRYLEEARSELRLRQQRILEEWSTKS